MTTTTVELTKPVGPDLSEARLDVYSSLMARVLSLSVVLVAVATFLAVPWLRHVNAADMTCR